MPASCLGSNVLVHFASGEAAKADRAEAIAAAGGAISVQIPNEVVHVARPEMPMSWAEIRVFLSVLRGALTVHSLPVETHDAGVTLAARYGLSLYDAVIAPSRLCAGRDTLWSEDMQNGMMLEGSLRIVNPFRATA